MAWKVVVKVGRNLSVGIEGRIAEHIALHKPIPFHWVWVAPHRAAILENLRHLGWHLLGNTFLAPAKVEGREPGGPYGDVPERV